jgi:phenylalanyl-tRNA synthetase alpha subunit
MKKQQPEKTTTKSQDQIIEPDSRPVDKAISDSERVEEGVQPAYRTYLEARKGLAKAFRLRVQQDQEAYKDAERQYQAYENAINTAIQLREKAERDALEKYREDLDIAIYKASLAYKEKLKQARMKCKQSVMDAWTNSMGTSTRMTRVFEEDRDITKEAQSPEKSRQHVISQLRDMILNLKRSFISFIQKARKSLEVRRG